MIRALYIISLILILAGCQVEQQPMELWYDQPATEWNEALPIGNGRLGAMIYGNPQNDRIQFNEETLWNGHPRDYHRENAHLYLDEIRDLLFHEKQDEAEKLASNVFMGKRIYDDVFETLKKEWSDSILKLPLVKKAALKNFNDSQWDTMYINYKSVWERKGLPDMDGSVFFRKTVSIPENWLGKDLNINLGKIKDHDFTYINGTLIGTKDAANTNRTYTIPGKLVNDTSMSISVLINNYVSTGGFNAVRKGFKKMHIIPLGLETDPVFIEDTWKYKVIDKKPPFFPQYQASYQPFGEIKLDFSNQKNITSYRRSLNLETAIETVSYNIDDIHYTREYLANSPDDLIAIRISASKEGQINFKASLETLHEYFKLFKYNEHTIGISVKVADGEMNGVALLMIESDGGTLETTNSSINVSDANSVVLKLVANTNYVSYKELDNRASAKAETALAKITDLSYIQIKENHLKNYQPLYSRFSIDLGEKQNRELPTNIRINNILTQPDNDLAATYVQYARYLMLSSGRQGTNPANLQGIWNEEIHPAWGSKYTTNINCEMNYWLVEPLHVEECHSSLFHMIDEIAEVGQKTAKGHYGANGWVLHHNTDQWRGTAPINNSNHGIWPAGGAWLCHHLWEHYLYSQDTLFLKETAYPLLKGSAEFFMDFLVTDPKSGYLISTPSNSPEHGGLVAGPTMDHQIIRSLFKIIIECSNILDSDKEFAAEIAGKLSQIAPDQIGHMGQLQEWMEDKDDSSNTHRHVSHLWGVHPGAEITWDKNPELMKAAIQSLKFRGDDGTGWSLAWKINFWARFMDGEHAHNMIQMLLSPQSNPDRPGSGGSYPNLFDAHPPFQIDGNYGGAAGIAEMLVQSHQGYIHVLPALPKQWSDGSIKGIRTRGGFIIDMSWGEGKITSLFVKSLAGKHLTIKYLDKIIEQDTEKGASYNIAKLH